MPRSVRTVFVSSTYRDLEKYRARVLNAINRLGRYKAYGMEHFGAQPATPADFCVKSVQECDLFLGIVGVCYGSSPPDDDRSYSEIEYDTARHSRKPCLMFLAPEDFRLPKKGLSCDRDRQKLFRRRVTQVCGTFKSPDDLVSWVYKALLDREAELRNFRSDISTTFPLAPEPWPAEDYPLQPGFTGRSRERQLLTDWWRDGGPPVFALLGLGGIGKSALAWVWLLSDLYGRKLPELGPQEGTALQRGNDRPDGAFWWSFHEQESSFAAFLDAALLYASDGTVKPASYRSPRKKIHVLLNLLQQRRLLLVLDGVERELQAPASAYDHLQEVRASFLRGLASLAMTSRTVLTSRYLPPELSDLAGCRRLELQGLGPADAKSFLHRQGVRGTRAELQALGKRYDYHPLSLRLLAGVIANDKREPGEIEVSLRQPEPRDLGERKPYPVVGLTYGMLSRSEQGLLHYIAACRSPVSYLVLETVAPIRRRKPLDAALDRLISLGLLTLDRERRRFDLHPLVRAYAYRRIRDASRRAIHQRLAAYFATFPPPGEVRTIEDLNASIELYHHNVKSGKYEQAYETLHDQLFEPLHYRLGAYSTNIELLRCLFPNGETALPRVPRQPETAARCFHAGTLFAPSPGLESPEAWTLSALGVSYRVSGSPRKAEPLLERARLITQQLGLQRGLAASLINLADVQWTLGKFRSVEKTLLLQIAHSLEWKLLDEAAVGCQDLGLRLAFRGEWEAAEEKFRRALEFTGQMKHQEEIKHRQAIIWAHRARKELLLARATSGEAKEMAAARALTAAEQARELLPSDDRGRNFVRALWLQGAAHCAKGHLHLAGPWLQRALDSCQDIDLVEFEADILLDLARLGAAEGKTRESESLASEALTTAERCDHVLQVADAHLVLAQIKLQRGEPIGPHAQVARDAASCDGPGYAYQVALDEANVLLSRPPTRIG